MLKGPIVPTCKRTNCSFLCSPLVPIFRYNIEQRNRSVHAPRHDIPRPLTIDNHSLVHEYTIFELFIIGGWDGEVVDMFLTVTDLSPSITLEYHARFYSLNPNTLNHGSMRVRVFIFLLSGLFCCLGFSGVFCFAGWAGACFFLLFGRGLGPRPNSKKNTPPPKQQKKKKRPRPFRACFLFAVWAGGCVLFFAVWAGACFILLFGRGRGLFFCCLGRGRVFFFCCLGGGREFTHLPVCLARL